MPDQCPTCSSPVKTHEHAIYSTTSCVKGKYVVLENIPVHICGCGVGYSLKCMGPLVDAIAADSDSYQHWSFNERSSIWEKKTGQR